MEGIKKTFFLMANPVEDQLFLPVPFTQSPLGGTYFRKDPPGIFLNKSFITKPSPELF